MSTNPDTPTTEPAKVRKFSASNRFEIEKVEENELNSSLKNIPMIDNLNESLDRRMSNTQAESSKLLPTSTSTESNKPSVLKKTPKQYLHDSYFDFDSNQNTEEGIKTKKQEKHPFFMAQNSIGSNMENEPLNPKIKEYESDDQNAGCFQLNYNEKNEPVSITCNLSSSGVNSYRNCVHDFRTVALYQKLLAEFIGTLLLTLYACSIGLPISENNVPSLNGCLGGGLTLASLVWVLGNVSGGHLNPAVTIAFLFTGKINPLLTVMYIGAQLVGALTGAFILNDVVPTEARGTLSVTAVHSSINLAQAFCVELIITFILVLTIFSCVDSRRNDLHGSFPLQIGIAVVVGGLFGGKFTGGSSNLIYL
jgi:glycerol uptake facilitator-like aquaporin